ncbi:hypothetical protein VTJ83DRAFT_1549 [Remersonia thermophila]|uniref:CCD97-like C-terminal domain-containing protein n=1 Tax=Remersonia thermophila TaxID=72144 RepID=A0ABR4DGB6_9PEZI
MHRMAMAPRFDSPPATPDDSLSRPRPRPPRSPEHAARIRVQNRRRAYLEKNPGYFESSEHELADPLLYDSLIRRFQTPAEREAEGRAKGYARVLEGSLLRGEERLARLREQQEQRQQQRRGYNDDDDDDDDDDEEEEEEEEEEEKEKKDNERRVRFAPPSGGRSAARPGGESGSPSRQDGDAAALEPGGRAFSRLAASLAPPPRTRAEGRRQWEAFLRDRFIRGEDGDFDYAGLVDGNDEYDVLERREMEERWFDEEEAEWASSFDDDDDDDLEEGDEKGGGGEVGGGAGGGRKRRKRERVLLGETGVQDF